jgi:hypothetical protein
MKYSSEKGLLQSDQTSVMICKSSYGDKQACTVIEEILFKMLEELCIQTLQWIILNQKEQ